jgi:hypothetical protein
LGPMQRSCFDYLFDQNWPIHPHNMIKAAQRGDLDFVRLLQERRVPLWSGACEEKPREPRDVMMHDCSYSYSAAAQYCRVNNIILIPANQQAGGGLWTVLRWGHACGAPVSPRVEDAFKAGRLATRAVMLSFHAAGRLSRGDDAGDHKAAWASMHAIPIELIEKILLHADLEIPESIRKPLFARPLVETPCHGPQNRRWACHCRRKCGSGKFRVWGFET